jgi:branched-chain amino acid aminotransferase
MNDCIGSSFIINGIEKSVSEFDEALLQSNNMVYEVIRVEDGIPLFIEDYFDRLEKTLILCGNKVIISRNEIQGLINRLLIINNCIQGPVKLMISPDVVMTYLLKPYKPKSHEYITGIKTILYHEERINPNAKVWNPGFRERIIETLIKHDAFEAILVNHKGEITEGSRSNIFFIKGKELFTAPMAHVLPGITRMKVMEACSIEKIHVNQQPVISAGIHEFDSAFLTGTSRKVLPIRQIDDIIFRVENDLMKKIAEKFEMIVSEYLRNKKGIQ